MPARQAVRKALNQAKGDSRKGIDGLCPWWHEVSTYCFQSAFDDADRAWKNWLDSLSGKRAGRRVGYPWFKKKGRSRDSFRLHHNVKKPTIRLAGYRRLRLPKVGEVRLHDSGQRLARLVGRGQAVVQSVTAGAALHRELDRANLDVEPRLLHHDLQPEHLVRTPEDPRQLPDWELAAFGDPVSGLARLAVRLRLASPQPMLALAHRPAVAARHRLEVYWRIHLLADAALTTDPEVRAHALTLTTGRRRSTSRPPGPARA